MMINWMVSTEHAKLDGLPKLMVNSDTFTSLPVRGGEIYFKSRHVWRSFLPRNFFFFFCFFLVWHGKGSVLQHVCDFELPTTLLSYECICLSRKFYRQV